MDYGYNSSSGAVIVALVTLVFIAIYELIIVAWYLVMALALSKFFRKVGVEPWIGWVPIYGYWKWLEVGGQAGALALLVLVPYAGIVPAIFLAIGSYRTGIAFRKDSSWVVLAIFVPFVWLFLLARQQEVYDPQLILNAGHPPPRAGFGAIVPGSVPPPSSPEASG
jgi:hypothetical protein